TTGTDAVPPGAVGGLTATPGVEQIVLRWSNPPDADLAKIRILRKETGPPSSPSDPAARVIDLPPNATTYTDTGLTPGKTYYYAIYAFDTSGNPSAVGAVVNQIPQAPAPLSKIPSVVPKKKPPTP